MQIFKDYDLSKLNTFGVKVKASFFTEVKNEADLKELFSSEIFKENEKLFLGGGSNVLFTKDFNGIVILNKLKGIEIVKDEKDFVLIRAMGGEIWHDLVLFTVERGYWGIENLSLIPGTVGATPVQNIGAYGVEIKDTLENVETYEIESGEKRVFSNEECEFGYRESVFKNKLKGKYFISAVTSKLSKNSSLDAMHSDASGESKKIYPSLQEYLKKNKIEVKNVKDISDAVIEIRKSKLPDPNVLGNAGSFFKNVFVNKDKLEELRMLYPDMPYFVEDGAIKIPAGWFIESCGWKGKKVGNIGMHEHQALVLVNYGGATGEEIKNLSDQIIASVFSKFGVDLAREVNLI